MDLGPSLIQAGGGLVADLFGYSSASQQQQFQERMSDTQYQRGTADMRAAGLNPAMMYGSAAPAPTPAGTMFTPDNPLKGFAQSMVDTKQLQLMDSQSDQAEANANLAGQQLKTQTTQQNLNSALTSKAIADTAVSKSTIDQIIADTHRSYSQSLLNSAMSAGYGYQNVEKQREAEIFGAGPVGTMLKSMQLLNPLAMLFK